MNQTFNQQKFTFKTIELFLSYYKKLQTVMNVKTIVNKIKVTLANVLHIHEASHHHHSYHYRPTLLFLVVSTQNRLGYHVGINPLFHN